VEAPVAVDDMKVQQSSAVTNELLELWEHAIKRLLNHRGGAELYATIRRDDPSGALLEALVEGHCVWTIADEEQLLGFAVVREHVVEGIFVDHHHRREKAATTLLKALVSSSAAPKDGFALPGDRGMKSLYESFGWKARLITMRGE
jgi:GNAT superfamily N-acetyltransferase